MAEAGAAAPSNRDMASVIVECVGRGGRDEAAVVECCRRALAALSSDAPTSWTARLALLCGILCFGERAHARAHARAHRSTQ